ncbi:MAG: hypothetical protein AAFO84_14440 [Cyanobacteria bacterium J06598_1]
MFRAFPCGSGYPLPITGDVQPDSLSRRCLPTVSPHRPSSPKASEPLAIPLLSLTQLPAIPTPPHQPIILKSRGDENCDRLNPPRDRPAEFSLAKRTPRRAMPR